MKRLQNGIKLRGLNVKIIHFILNTHITKYGTEPTIAGLIVFNHRSYFDPLVILKDTLAFPVAKKEVDSWPLIGHVCRATGVIFVERESKKSRTQTLKEVRDILNQGFSILIAPEGTTHIEPLSIEFKPGAFLLAAELDVPVIPVAIDYKNINDAWIGNDTFVPHFFKCFGKWKTEINVSFLDPVKSASAEELITISKNKIDTELIRFRKNWDRITF
ncbi:1-acyl-sn-glycerol-3-phosphate acyltransferase [Lutibacter sp.]|uniref:lysophospholipid acyltransferase family protein n=1 Tax=Lutibacter sp. TaxID=1925666 RepID=UPI002736F3A7|nr:lysophospholipid acyltransferase family protein [Lutibacter sp.]MDP3312532.1 lysophospholipid acyltransferase family protein [Lutibacter sp.]